MTDLEGFVNASGRDDAVAAVRKRIDKEGITYIYFQFASVTGRIMGKGVAGYLEALEWLAERIK